MLKRVSFAVFLYNIFFKQPWQSTHLWDLAYIYGYPRLQPNYLNMLTAFPGSVWCLVIFCTVTNTLMFVGLVHFYVSIAKQEHLVRNQTTKWDVVFKVISTLTEPDEIKLFPVWSTGMTKKNGIDPCMCMCMSIPCAF